LVESEYSGRTVQVKESHAFDAARLDEYLYGTIQGYAGPSTVRQFEGGQSNFTYLLTTPKRKYVLRRKPPGRLLKSAHAVDREFRVMRALGAQGFPVPEMFVLCEDESVVGTMFYVMSHVPGRVFVDSSMPSLTREHRAAIYDSVNAALARLHSLDYRALGLEDFGRPGNYFARQIARWCSQYEASKTEDIPEMEKLAVWLAASIPDDGGRVSVIHGDFSFHNVLVHPTEPRVAAVLDWELSTIGHPLADLICHVAEWYRPIGVDHRGTLKGTDLAALGIPTMEQYMARYAQRTGFSLPQNLAFYRAFTLFRHAAILQGITGRVRDGTATASDAAEMAARVRPLARAAWSEAMAADAA
jgi:aminoglycoside phosphotransferase (APT) family kinase protein